MKHITILTHFSKTLAIIAMVGSIVFTKTTSAQSNLIVNPGFTDGTTAWSTDCSIEINPESVYGGVSSNPVTEIDIERCINQEVSISAGAIYDFSYKASRRQGSTPATVGVNLTITGVQSGTVYINENRTYNNSTWFYTTENFTFQIPVSAVDTRVNIKFSNYFTTGTYGTLIDDLTLSVNALSGVLPVRFIGFTGKMKKSTASLNWTASNDNNEGKYFIIERSASQGKFDSIGKVNVTESGITYSFNDNNVLPGTNNYRLKAVNKNGVYSYSNIISLNNSSVSSMKLYPNPATSSLGITVINPSTASASVQIYTISGSIVMNSKINLNEGSNALSFDVSSFTSGSYILKVVNNSGLNFVQSFSKK